MHTKKICIIGDNRVGKTTFIKLLLTGTYTETNEKIIKDNILLNSSKFGIKYYNYPIELIDCSGINDKEELIPVLKVSNLVIIMYDFSMNNTFNKLKNDFLPILNSIESIYSILIVGNKLDMIDVNSQKVSVEQDRKEVEKFQEDDKINIKYFAISCKNYLNISILFSNMIDSLVNPIHLLYKYDIFNQTFIKALIRIFRILDKDKKGIISKIQFVKIHESVFKASLSNDDLIVINDLLKDLGSTNLIMDSGINLQNFISLNEASVQLEESQIAWTILRKYGYSDDLTLDYWYFNEKKFKESNEVYELTDYTKNLLIDLFSLFKIGNLLDYVTLFETVTEENIFDLIPKKEVSLEEWLFIWNVYVRINYKEAFKIFLYLGYDIEFASFLKKVNKRNLTEKQNGKTVYISHVCNNIQNVVLII